MAGGAVETWGSRAEQGQHDEQLTVYQVALRDTQSVAWALRIARESSVAD